jgi:RNA polymerase sigma-70 factor, ECF subfamily
VGAGLTAQRAFDQYYRAVFNFVRRLTHSVDAAEDITQECFLSYVRAPERFDEVKGGLRTYLFAIARNLALKRYRGRGAECQLESDAWLMAGDPRPGIEASAAVERAVAALPMIEKEALILFQYKGMTLVEIGHIVGRRSRNRQGPVVPCAAALPSGLGAVSPGGGMQWSRMNGNNFPSWNWTIY